VPLGTAAVDDPAAAVPDASMGVGATYLVEELGKLMHRDINTSLTELGSAYLHGTDVPDAYYANLALAATLGQLRLGIEHRLEGSSLNLKNLVAESYKASANKNSLDTKTFEHLRNVLVVLSGDANTQCTALDAGADNEHAINQGVNMGRAIMTMLDHTYALGRDTVLSAEHPVVRLGAMLTSVLAMTQAKVVNQTEVNAAIHAQIRPIWSAPLNKDSFHASIAKHFE